VYFRTSTFVIVIHIDTIGCSAQKRRPEVMSGPLFFATPRTNKNIPGIQIIKNTAMIRKKYKAYRVMIHNKTKQNKTKQNKTKQNKTNKHKKQRFMVSIYISLLYDQ
jgi:hypothetical protein